MLDQQLVAHIRTQLAFGKSKEDIVKELAGISDSDIAEAFTAAGVMPPMQAAPSESMYAQSSSGQTQSNGKIRSLILYGAVALAVIAMTAGVSYAYMQKLWFFGGAPYSEDDLVSGILSSFSGIDSARYTLSGSLEVVPRDGDAVPFTLKISNEAEVRQQYQNDALRAQDVRAILATLERDYVAGGISYPAMLPKMIQPRPTAAPTPLKVADPKTDVLYTYAPINNGQDFSLSVTFETDAAVRVMKRSYAHSENAPTISGKTVTYTKDSADYAPYLPVESPKPFIVELSDMARFLPPDIQARVSVSAASDWGGESSEWTFNVDAEGDFGDLTYKVNADLLKKNAVYYFRINNLPGIFLGSLPIKKGEWISADPAAPKDETKKYSVSSSLMEAERSYKEARTEIASFMRKVASIADEEKLLRLKNVPVRENVDGRALYRYELEFQKEAIVPFYRRMMSESANYEHLEEAQLFNDQGLIEYLESDEFSQMFDYISKNTSFVVWVDEQGRLGAMEYTMRLVPPDTAPQLKDEQAVATMRLELSELNEDIVVEQPQNAKSFTEFAKEMDAKYNSSGKSAVIKSGLNNMQAQAKLVYDKSNSYGTVAFPLGPCAKTPGTLFGNETVFRMIETASEGANSPLICASTKTAFAISAPLPGSEGYSWCTDSTGASQQILGAIKGPSCR